MFWTDWGRYPRIEKAWLSGEGRHPLVIHEVIWPNDVALDVVLKRVYWADNKLDRIESISYNGDNRCVPSNSYCGYNRLVLYNHY